MRLGVCWYPEQWPVDTWYDDVALMADVGLRVVRIGEFAWTRLEPSPDAWDFAWLDRAIDMVASHGMEVVLGTPTATPPVWLMKSRPDIVSIGPDGRRRAYGSRRHTCPTSVAYRDEARRVVTALRDRYGDHDAVTAWQIDNEPGNHDSARCWCGECQTAFTAWLTARFDGDLDVLNDVWGTVFWSQTYDDFEDVRLPVPTMTRHNPALDLAHLRFSSVQVVAGLAEQREILATTGRPTFTNLYLGSVDIDGAAVGRLHGLGAVDSYPHGVSGADEVAFILDLTRGTSLAAGAGVDALGGHGWVVEQQPGAVNWTGWNPVVPPGQVRMWGWQAALHGIDTLMFFRWRAAVAGQEQYHTGLLRHDGTPDRGLAEARRLASELDQAPPGLLTRPPAKVALVANYDDAWAVDLDPHVDGLTHRQLVVAAHTGARRLGFDVDVVPADADLTGYEVVVCPALHLDTVGRRGALLAAADAGVQVVVGVRSLVKATENSWVQVPEPAGLTARVGSRVDEWGSAFDLRGGAPTFVLGDQTAAAGPWAETFAPVDGNTARGETEVVARWKDTHRDGLPAAVRRDGVTFMGAASADAWTLLLAHITDRKAGDSDVSWWDRGGIQVRLDHVMLTSHNLPDAG